MPFNSNNKYAFSIRKYKTPTSDLCLFTKGAPERIWDLCTHVLLNGEIIPKTKEWDKKFKEINDYFGRNGERVLGFAKKHIERDHLPEKLDLQNPNFGFKE
jgi:sodium/potassium-transporting ATPase subunit alpha